MKKTLHFSSPVYLKTSLRQLEITSPSNSGEPAKKITVPIEDIGVVILENPQITISHVALAELLEQNIAVITCNNKRMPNGLFLPLEGNTLQSRRFKDQVDASLPLKKQLWQQTVRQKINNQGQAIARQGIDATPLFRWRSEVRSGDPENVEAKAAAWYWPRLFRNTSFFINLNSEENPDNFIRERYGEWPNCLLNYGYAVLRAIVARTLVGAGLLPTLGIFHRNQYNAFCLADDIMEPYRPAVDTLVCRLVHDHPRPNEHTPEGELLTPEIKRQLLLIPVMDVIMENQQKPLQLAAQRTAASLAACFAGQSNSILFPEIG